MILILIPSIAAAKTPIIIDGYFDDWSDKPHTAFYYDIYNSEEIKNVALFCDDTTIYGHIKMSEMDGKFGSFTIYLNINNSYTIELVILCTDSNNEVDWDKSILDLQQGTHFNVAVFNNKDYTALLGDAALLVHNNNYKPGDDIEFSIKYDKIKEYCNNIPFNEVNDITLTCPSLGSQSITIAGTFTEPFLGIIITLTFIGIVLLYRKYKQTGKSI